MVSYTSVRKIVPWVLKARPEAATDRLAHGSPPPAQAEQPEQPERVEPARA